MTQHARGSDVPTEPARVLIVDDHEVLTASLAQVLDHEPDLTVVGAAGTLEKARALLATEAPDVVLLDHRMPDGDGVEAIPELLALRPEASIVVLTATTVRPRPGRRHRGRRVGLRLEDPWPRRGHQRGPGRGGRRVRDLPGDAGPAAAAAAPARGGARVTP